MFDPSPRKSRGKMMKYKYDKYLNIFPQNSIKKNVEQIRDMEIGHVNMNEFLRWVEKAPTRMSNLFASELHKYASFPIVSHDLDFVLAVVDHFDPNTKQVEDVQGNVVICLDSEFFNSVFKGSSREEVVDITPTSAYTNYEENMNKCNKNINTIFLQTAQAIIKI